jgi:hypothetical protein
MGRGVWWTGARTYSTWLDSIQNTHTYGGWSRALSSMMRGQRFAERVRTWPSARESPSLPPLLPRLFHVFRGFFRFSLILSLYAWTRAA